MKSSLIDQGLELMLYGMGMVFVFLAVLIVLTSCMSYLVQSLVPAESSESLLDNATTESDTTLLAVIGAAIEKHRSRQK